MAAAIGQSRLMTLYDQLFSAVGCIIGQVLLTHDDLKHRTRHLNARNTILAMLRRRPCTAQQMAHVFGMHLNEVSKYVGKLLRTRRIRADRAGNDVYYAAADGTSRP